jgi:hypothetical protein
VLVVAIPFICHSLPVVADDRAATEFFEKSIRPLIVEKCQTCHGAKTAKAGLRLTDRASLLKGGDSGPAVVPNAPNESPLVHAVRYLDEVKMPPAQKLSVSEIAAIERWVASGAEWPSSKSKATLTKGFEPSAAHWTWWAFQRTDGPGSVAQRLI